MDLLTLKKKLSTYESDKGYLKNVSDDVLYEVLVTLTRFFATKPWVFERSIHEPIHKIKRWDKYHEYNCGPAPKVNSQWSSLQFCFYQKTAD